MNPGTELAAYRIDGTAGEQLQFHSVSTSSTSGSWELIGENNQQVAGAALGTDFDASLPATAPYYLELVGNITTAINYSFQITDLTTYPPIASSGFDAEHSGTLANGASTSFTFKAPAGLPVYFNSLGFSEPITATLTDPGSHNVFNYTPYYFGNTGPYLLTSSGDLHAHADQQQRYIGHVRLQPALTPLGGDHAGHGADPDGQRHAE